MWKLSPRILFLFLTCAMLSDCLSGAKLKCSFGSSNIGYISNNYYCQVVDNVIYDGSLVTIDGVETPHLSGKSNDNVNAIYFYQISKLTYFPRNIENVFKNLIGIFVYNSNLQEITQDDLRHFPKLKEISLYSNKITSIEANLFKFNLELKYVRFQSNQISHIDPNVFDHLNNLERLDLIGNKCKSQFNNAGTRSEVLSYIYSIRNGDCASTQILQKKKETENQLIKNITTLQAANEECSTKFNEMKINLASAINEKSTLNKDLNELRDQHEKLKNDYLSCEMSKNNSISEFNTQHEDQSRKLSEMQESLQESKKMNDELNKKNQALIENSDQLKDKLLISNDKILNLVEQMNEMRAKYENLLQTKLAHAEKLVDKLIEKKTIANDDDEIEKKDGNSDCLTLYFGPQQRPIILTN